MVDPVTITAATKGFEGATSLGVEAAKGAAESLQTSAVNTAGAGGMHGGMGRGPANFSGGPMPGGFVSDPMGGTQRSVGSGGAEKTGAPQPQQSKSLIEKANDFYKTHKDEIKTIKDKVHTVAQAERSVNHIGTDMMGSDAKRNNPETNVRAPRWGRW